MKPVAWIKIRELSYMQAVHERGATEWRTNLGLKPEPDDEGLYTETQVQKMRESFEQSVTDPENQPSQYGTVLMEEKIGLTEREIELLDGMIEVQLNHAERCDSIANRSMAEKQKGWDMERVALLQKIKKAGKTK
jgi:hypothetical protein